MYISASSLIPSLPKGLSIGGGFEIEATGSDTYAGVNSSDLALAKAELFIDAQPHDYLGTHVQFLYEDGSSNITLGSGELQTANIVPRIITSAI